MKNLFTYFTIAGMAAIVACGPSAEEKAAMEKAKQDSIMAVEEAAKKMEEARQDSIRMAEEAAKAMEQARLDSIAKAAEMEAAAAKGKKPAKKAEPKKEEVKAGQGKG